MITVFTPAYNRAYIIEALYRSLCRQTSKDFEWIVVDDGSTDNTPELLASFQAEGAIPMRIFRTPNGGKHRAVNLGVKEACGELFFIVDSDDYLADNAVERVAYHYDAVRDDESFAGVSGLRAHFSGERIGGECDFGVMDCTSMELRETHSIRGDMAEAYRTAILRAYPFPEYPGEKFVSEAVVWNRIAERYKLRYFYEKICFCEYLEDGLSHSILRHHYLSPRSSALYFFDLARLESLSPECRDDHAKQYWRYRYACTGRLERELRRPPLWMYRYRLLRDGWKRHKHEHKLYETANS